GAAEPPSVGQDHDLFFSCDSTRWRRRERSCQYRKAKSSMTKPTMMATNSGGIPNTVRASIHPNALFVHAKHLAIPATWERVPGRTCGGGRVGPGLGARAAFTTSVQRLRTRSRWLHGISADGGWRSGRGLDGRFDLVCKSNGHDDEAN